MANFDVFISSIMADGNDGKAFERFCQHFLETSPEYRSQFEKVWLWDDWPGKWSHDKGVDLIAKYKGKEKYCAVQAKCYAAHNTVPYDEVTNFLADSNRVEIEDRILMMSTNKLSEKTSKEVIAGQEKQVVIRDRQYFESISYEYPNHISEISSSKIGKKAEPRHHQAKAIDDVEAGFLKNDRGQLIMACGTGKTFTTLWIKERLKAKSVLVLLPSLSLLSQTMREWVWGANEEFEALAVCSDPTVGKSKNSEDISTSEVGKVTWDVQEIKSFLKRETPKVVFCTYQSSELIEQAQKDIIIPSFDLTVCDEAHRCAGKVEAGFATILHQDKIRSEKRLFTTATPRYYGKNVISAAEGRGVEIVGMDDETKFGPVLHRLTFGKAIEMKMLTDYQVVVVGVDEPMVRAWISEGEIVSFGDSNLTDARTLAAKIAVLKAIKDYDIKRLISFHNSIKRAKEFASDVFEVVDLIERKHRPFGNIWSQHVDGTMSAGKRRDLINGLKELDGFDIGLLTNARCLSEGVDVPSLDGVAFIDPRGSQVDIIQAVGRAIRKSKSKTKGTIVLPVFLKEGDDPDSVIDETTFKTIWDVLKALRSHDEVLADELDQYRTDMGLGVSRASNKLEKVVFDLPMSVDSSFATKFETRLVEASTENWYFWYGLLEDFFKREGHSLIERDVVGPNKEKLGLWVGNQRARKNRLNEDQLQKLESVNFVWDVLDHNWRLHYNALKRFYDRESHSIVPWDYLDGKVKLGGWVISLRTKRSELSNKRLQQLSEVDFVWDLKNHHWENNFKLLETFFRDHKHSDVPSTHQAGGVALGTWVAHQRRRKSKGTLPSWQEEKLDLLDFIWDTLGSKWDKAFSYLENFFEENGHLQVPDGYRVNDFALRAWVKDQRKNWDSLDLSRKKRLLGLGFQTDPHEEQWNASFEIYKKYLSSGGSLEVPAQHHFEGINLGSWLNSQRQGFKKGKLSDHRLTLLNSVGFITDHEEFTWEKNFELVKDYLSAGASLVPKNLVIDNYKVGSWCSTQRQKFKNGTLDNNKINMLNSIGFIWDLEEYHWISSYNILKRYYEQYGHSFPPDKFKFEGFSIRNWINNQRINQKSLSRWQIEKLNTVEFVWDTEKHKLELEKQKWEKAFDFLKRFYEKNGHSSPLYRSKFEGFAIYLWAKKQREIQKSLSPWQIEKLNSIEFKW